MKRITRKDKIDHDFIAKVKNLKTCNGLLDQVKKPYFQEEAIDKLLLYYKVDSTMHIKIDKNLLPKKKRNSYFEAVEASGNVGQGSYKLTRYKVWEEPPKLVVEHSENSDGEGGPGEGGTGAPENTGNDSKMMKIDWSYIIFS